MVTRARQGGWCERKGWRLHFLRADLAACPSFYQSISGLERFLACGGFHSGGSPIAGWFVVENSKKKWMIWGYHHFRKPSCVFRKLQNI